MKENVGSDRSWVWNCPADFAETAPTEEIFAIRFANAESKSNISKCDFNSCVDAQLFKKEFEKCQEEMKAFVSDKSSDKATDEVSKKLESLAVDEKKKEEETKQ